MYEQTDEYKQKLSNSTILPFKVTYFMPSLP